MSSPQPPASPPASGGNRLLIGCGIGCGVLLLAFVGASAVTYFKVLKPMAEGIQQMEKDKETNRIAVRELVELDTVHVSRLGEDKALAVLSAADVDRYVKVRTRLAPQAAGAERARQEMAAVFDPAQFTAGGMKAATAVFGMMGNMFGALREVEQARGELLVAARETLDEQGLGPTELASLVEIVEWRFLRRPEAVGFGLSESERFEYYQQRFQVRMFESILKAPSGSQVQGTDRAELERQIEKARERMEELEKGAESRKDLSPATRSLLESRRAELEALPAEGLSDLTTLTNADAMIDMNGLPGMTP